MAELERRAHQFDAVRRGLAVVCFGSEAGAAAWLADTGCSLPLLRDPARTLYKRLGLARSVSRVWSPDTLHYYAGQVAAGRTLPAVVAGQEDDPLQMGGDFTLNCSTGTLIMSHPRDRQHMLYTRMICFKVGAGSAQPGKTRVSPKSCY